MDAKEFVKQVKTLDVRIKNKLVERQQWYDMALTITANMSGERVQSSGNKSKMGDAINVCVDTEAEIFQEVCNLRDRKKEVIQALERLDSATEYDVLHRRYLQYQSLQEIADHYKKDYGWSTTVHGRALKSLQAVLDEQ